jgi:two-component system, LytTR family, response regulator
MITCLFLDDELHSIELLEIYASRMPQLHIAATFTDPLLAAEAMKTQSFDLVFVDQQMPHITGIDFIQQHRGQAKFVLTTAYTDLNTSGLENDIIDYLVKPFPFSKFEAAIQKAAQWLPAKQDFTTPL